MRILASAILSLGLAVSFGAGAAGGGEGHVARHGADLNLLPPPEKNAELSTRPGAVKLESPAALAQVEVSGTTLNWSESAGAEVYHLQVATDPHFKWLIVDDANLKATTFEVKNLEANQQYFWRVAGRRPANDSSYTKGFFVMSSFRTR